MSSHEPDEGTALLDPHRKKAKTPLPWAQLWIVIVLQLAEPLTSQVIYPFVPQVSRRPMAYFVGLILVHSLYETSASPMETSVRWDIMSESW
jgi:hypothetical protein